MADLNNDNTLHETFFSQGQDNHLQDDSELENLVRNLIRTVISECEETTFLNSYLSCSDEEGKHDFQSHLLYSACPTIKNEEAKAPKSSSNSEELQSSNFLSSKFENEFLDSKSKEIGKLRPKEGFKSYPLSPEVKKDKIEMSECLPDSSASSKKRILKLSKHFWKCPQYIEDENGELIPSRDFWKFSSPLHIEQDEEPLGYFKSSASDIENSEESKRLPSPDVGKVDDEPDNKKPEYFQGYLPSPNGEKKEETNNQDSLEYFEEYLSSYDWEKKIKDIKKLQSEGKSTLSPADATTSASDNANANQVYFAVAPDPGYIYYATGVTEEMARDILEDFVACWNLKPPWKKSIVFDKMVSTDDSEEYFYVVTCGKPTATNPVPNVVKIYFTVSIFKKLLKEPYLISYTLEGSKFVRTEPVFPSVLESVLKAKANLRPIASSIMNLDASTPEVMTRQDVAP